MAIKRCTPERGDLLGNIANNINMAVKACPPESDNLLSELANGIDMTMKASVPRRNDLLKILLNNVNAAIGANSSMRDNLLRAVANDIERAIGQAHGTNQDETKSLDERYCDVKGNKMDLGLAGTFSLHRVFSCHLTTSNPQVVWVV